MCKPVQQVPIGPGRNLYIMNYDPQQGILTFRSTDHPGVLFEEEITMDGEMVYTKDYHFHISFLRIWAVLE